MSKKIILLCAAALLTVPLAHGLNEQIQAVFEQFLEHGNFPAARKLIAEQAFPNEKDALLNQIDQAEEAFKELEESELAAKIAQESDIEDLVAQNKISQAIDALMQRGFPADEAQAVVRAMQREHQAIPLPESPRAGAAAASPRSSRTPTPPLSPEQLNQVYGAISADDEDAALAIIMSTNVEYDEAQQQLKDIMLDFYAKQPRRPSPVLPQVHAGKIPDISDLIEKIKIALDEDNLGLAERISADIEQISKRYPELEEVSVAANFLIAQAKDKLKSIRVPIAPIIPAIPHDREQRLANMSNLVPVLIESGKIEKAKYFLNSILAQAPKGSKFYIDAQQELERLESAAPVQTEEVENWTMLLDQARMLEREDNIEGAKDLYERIFANTPSESPEHNHAGMRLNILKKTEPAAAKEPAPTVSVPVFEIWAGKIARANELSNSRSLSEQAQAKKLYKEIISGSAPEDIKKNARIALRKLA